MESADWFNVSEAMSRNATIVAVKILLVILAFIVTGAVIIPLVNKYYRIPKGKKPIQGIEALFTSFSVLALFGAIFMASECGRGFSPRKAVKAVVELRKIEYSYWTFAGWDWWRMPLEYPYELSSSSLYPPAAISRWDEKTTLVDQIVRYRKDGGIILGVRKPYTLRSSLAFRESDLRYAETEAEYEQTLREIDSIESLLAERPDSTYFIFDCDDASVLYFDSSRTFLEEIKHMGYEEIPPMPTVYKNWRIYVRPPRDSSYKQIGPSLRSLK